MLREAGYSVLAKTTGSKPVLILPDESEAAIRRRGGARILEQKRLLRQAAGLGVRALVAELMSVRPECGRMESCWILRPQILVITNVRLDHREEMGYNRDEIAASLARAIPLRATVILPEGEVQKEFEAAAGRVGARLVAAPRRGNSAAQGDTDISPALFAEQADIVLALAELLGIPEDIARRGMARAHPDFGALKAWNAVLGVPGASWLLVSAFAANEPESTGRIIERLRRQPALSGRPLIGLLVFRPDRGDRTRQWLDAVDRGFFSGFERVYVAGAHQRTIELRRRMRTFPFLSPLGTESPPVIMDRIFAAHPGGGTIVGMGNMVGLGAGLVEHWERIGRPHAL